MSIPTKPKGILTGSKQLSAKINIQAIITSKSILYAIIRLRDDDKEAKITRKDVSAKIRSDLGYQGSQFYMYFGADDLSLTTDEYDKELKAATVVGKKLYPKWFE